MSGALREKGLSDHRISSLVPDAPAAVLLVDLDGRSIVHANPVAQQLAPGIKLPVDLDTWSDAAGLRDQDDAELSETRHPLSRILRAETVMGQAVTAGRASELGGKREPLWVVGLPMREAPSLQDHALVVFLPATSWSGGQPTLELGEGPEGLLDAGTSGSSLRDRAVLATGLSFTVADAKAEDVPLVWVNPAFTRTTGYEFEEVVGRNCRFLQGPDTDPEVPRAMREALAKGEGFTSVLLNYTKEGEAFWNQVTISPIFSGDGDLTHFVGIQGDVSGRIEADLQRDAALLAEQAARAEAEAAQGRLRLLAEATNLLAATLDVAECRARLIEIVVPELADWTLVLHLDDEGAIESIDHAHCDPASAGQLEQLVAELPTGLREGRVDQLFLQGRQGRRINDLSEPDSVQQRLTYAQDETLLRHTEALGSRSAIYVPLPGRREVDDVMILVRGKDREQFSDDDLHVAVDLGRRVGLILDNARMFAVQQRIAQTLQRSLLTPLPSVPGIRAAARYQAVESGAEVGGDFHELVVFPDERVGLIVGDVIGHDIYAAAAMGHLKGVLRACAYDASATPAAVFERVDELLAGMGMPTMATAVYADLAWTGEQWRLTWSSAGHPPIVVRHLDGSVETLGEDFRVNDILLGVGPSKRRNHERLLPAGTVVVAYTDGLIERRTEMLDEGIARLLTCVATGPGDVDALCDHLLEELGPTGGDDVVIVALELGAK